MLVFRVIFGMRTATKLQNIFGIIQIFRIVFFKKIYVYAHKNTGDCQCMGMEWGDRSLASCLEEMNYRCKSCAETKKVKKIDIFFQ